MKDIGIISTVVIGLIAGWIAQYLMGRSNGLIGTLMIGLVGAFIGPIMLQVLGIWHDAGIVPTLVVATIGSVVLLFVLGMLRQAGKYY